MRGTAKVGLAAVAVAAVAVLSTSTPSIAESAPEAVTYELTVGDVRLGVQQCIGIGIATEVVEQTVTDPNGQQVTVKVPGQHRHHDLVCTRAMTDDDTLVEWQRRLLAGSPDARQDVELTLFDATLAELARFRYVSAWPSELTYLDSSQTGGPLLEVVTIVADRLERVS